MAEELNDQNLEEALEGAARKFMAENPLWGPAVERKQLAESQLLRAIAEMSWRSHELEAARKDSTTAGDRMFQLAQGFRLAEAEVNRLVGIYSKAIIEVGLLQGEGR